MAIRYRTEGIVLAKQDRGEANRIFIVFTKEFGKLHLWATSERNINSKLRGGLELLYCSDLEFVQGRAKKTITDAFLKNSFEHVRSDLRKLRIALRIAETLNTFLKGEIQDARVWDLLVESLNALNQSQVAPERCSTAYYYFFWNLVALLGWKPQADQYGKQVAGTLNAFFSSPLNSLVAGPAPLRFSAPLHGATKKYFLWLQKELQ